MLALSRLPRLVADGGFENSHTKCSKNGLLESQSVLASSSGAGAAAVATVGGIGTSCPDHGLQRRLRPWRAAEPCRETGEGRDRAAGFSKRYDGIRRHAEVPRFGRDHAPGGRSDYPDLCAFRSPRRPWNVLDAD